MNWTTWHVGIISAVGVRLYYPQIGTLRIWGVSLLVVLVAARIGDLVAVRKTDGANES